MSFGAPGTFNVGPDLSLSISSINPALTNGASIVQLDGRRTRFDATEDDHLVLGDAIDNGGLIDARRVPGRWNGSIEVERNCDSLSALMAFMDQAFYDGPNGQPFFTITTGEPWTNENFGSEPGVYQFTGVVLHGYNRGSWTRTDRVKPVIKFSAQQCKKIA